jgi:tRNA (mo5U34)-methyltransferase
VLAFDEVFRDLAAAGLGGWREQLERLLAERLADSAHGDLPRWREALAMLPRTDRPPARLDTAVVAVGPDAFPPEEHDRVRTALLRLAPWRKGPFKVGDILIDAEWRSDRKWERLQHAVTPLAGRLVLDVGCGNGYYALRMRGAGARLVVGVEPMLLYLAQFRAIRHWMPPEPVHVLPLRLEELPGGAGCFDTVFSMGVLYHRRAPITHLRQLREALVAGGELVLETLILPGSVPEAKTPERYARMRNIWHLPTLPQLIAWLAEAGLVDTRVVDVSATAVEEQRSTEWMPWESLAEALDPEDPAQTIEGWPAPRRAIVLCRKP